MDCHLPPEFALKSSLTSSKWLVNLFIGSICRLWRDTAWSTPLLWSTIFLHISGRRSRARLAPLTIKLFAEDEHKFTVCTFQAIMRVLVTKSNYWHTFESFLPPQCHHVFENINFPMLTSVSVHPPKSTLGFQYPSRCVPYCSQTSRRRSIWLQFRRHVTAMGTD
jgi:hypothetical protein